jgi:hypothetical protein
MSGRPSITLQNPTGMPYGVKQLDSTKGSAGENIPVVGLSDDKGNANAAQFPLSADGDSVYAKDVNLTLSDIGSFTGAVTDFFDNYAGTNVAASAGAGGDNPKSFKIVLERPVIASTIGIGSPDTSLSNAKLILRGLDGTALGFPGDYSADDTKRGIVFFSFEQTAFIELEIFFYTDDEVTVGGMTIFKSQTTTIGAIDGLIPFAAQSTTPLLADATWTSGVVDTKNYVWIIGSVYSDVASATDGFKFEFSSDKINWRWVASYTVAAATAKTFSEQTPARYMRMTYTNGGTDQTVFDVSTKISPIPSKPSSHRMSDSVSDQDDAELVKAGITGLRDDNTFGNAILDNEDNLRVNSFPYTYAIAENAITGHSPLLKFGTRTTVAAGTPSTIWEGPTALYAYMTTAQQLKVSSTDNVNDNVGGTGALTLTLVGLDATWSEVTETITMTGTTVVTTTNSYIRIFRAYVATCGTSYTNTGTISVTNNAGTVTQLIINIGDGQTLMALWTVPLGKVAYLTHGTFSTDSNKGARASLFSRLNDGGTLYPWQIKYRAFAFSGNENFPFTIPFKIPAKTDIEVRVNTPTAAGATSCGSTFELWYEDA